MKLPEYPLPEGMRWIVHDDQFLFTGAYSEADKWWYGWVRTDKANTQYLTVATEKKNRSAKKEHGRFPSADAACKFLSAYLILGDINE